MQHSEFVIWGAKGHGLVLAEIIGMLGGRVIAFFDRDKTINAPIPELPIYYGDIGFTHWIKNCPNPTSISAISAIGGARGLDRCEYLEIFRKARLRLPTLIHPSAIVSPSAALGSNCHILAGAVVSTAAQIGDACIINTNASVDHECIIERGVHIAPGATLCGCVHIGEYSMIGANAVILPSVKIGKNVLIGAGAVVTRNVPDNVIAFGSPAKIVRNNIT